MCKEINKLIKITFVRIAHPRQHSEGARRCSVVLGSLPDAPVLCAQVPWLQFVLHRPPEANS